MKTALALLLVALVPALFPRPAGGGFTKALTEAGKALEAGDLDKAHHYLGRALERDPHALAAWELTERWAAQAKDKDEQVYALHRQLALSRAQKKDKAALEAIRARLLPLDPQSDALAKLRTTYVDRFVKLGDAYEKLKRPHSAIQAFKNALALDPDRADLAATIERIAAAPDPSLAENARPRDLLEGISTDWIAEHDAKHSDWGSKAVLEKTSYVTQTDAGYAVLVRAAEAMEQMNGFYRQFFRHGDKATPRIFLNIFKTREEYLKLGEGPPVEWSGGHFTGSAVETYITAAGFEDTVGTLFHEAAHQFVDLKTNAEGWLNEGLASFFEGSRILANGTVLMNLPANHRLFPLASRMERGWMTSATDGIEAADANKEPATAPSFRLVLENQYEWGPPWYAPTWGLVYFLYNFQDPSDGRFLYRKAFGDFIDASGGKSGEAAIETFEEVVLANPEPPTPGQTTSGSFPKTVDDLNEVWKRWILDLRDRQQGVVKETPPYLKWARNAVQRKAQDDAIEFFERAVQLAPTDLDVLSEFAALLSERKNDDRAAKLLAAALAVLENTEPVDKKRLSELDARLRKVDPSYAKLDEARTTLITDVTAVIDRYYADGLNLQGMEVAYHLGNELAEPALFALYEKGVRAEGHSLAAWRLAYNEEDLRGWSAGLETYYKPGGETLNSKFGSYSPAVNDYSILTLDELTSGDFSLECELEAEANKVNFAGLVFGRKSATDCHALILYPPALDKNGFVNLVTFYGSGSADTWRRNPVQHPDAAAENRDKSRSSVFYKLRIDVIGRLVDVWVNGEYQATQEFPNLDILRGTFGLITGRGEARFKNVRFLARHPRDPSSAIERKMTLDEKKKVGEAINGSWLGLRPPFPTAQRWFSKPRQEWGEALGYPQLFVMWSVDQNDAVPIDGYLRHVADSYKDSGLEFVNLLAFWDEGKADAYLQAHPFPGSVGLDTPTEAERNFGITFERFDVVRFQLPRFLLLDIDGKVAWEGDPGFAKGAGWNGEESLLDVPLRELIAKRRLTEFTAWRKAWPDARAALGRGEFDKAAPALKGAGIFDPSVSAEVAEASALLSAVEGAAAGLDALGEKLTKEGREPALDVLVAWAETLGKPPKKSKGVVALLKNPVVAAWKKVPGMLKPVVPKAGKDAAAVEAALTKVAELPGAFPAEFAAAAREVAGDPAAFKALVDGASTFPGRWLASQHFGW